MWSQVLSILRREFYYVVLKQTSSVALAEARDITLYLNPLTRHFQQLEDTEFSECKVLLKPLMHVVCLIWSNSLYYCHSAKLIGKAENIGWFS